MVDDENSDVDCCIQYVGGTTPVRDLFQIVAQFLLFNGFSVIKNQSASFEYHGGNHVYFDFKGKATATGMASVLKSFLHFHCMMHQLHQRHNIRR